MQLHGRCVPDMVEFNLQLVDARSRCARTANTLRRRRAALGMEEKANLAKMKKDIYLTVHLNARAVKTRIHDRLRQRKFELERLERSYRATMTGVLIVNLTRTCIMTLQVSTSFMRIPSTRSNAESLVSSNWFQHTMAYVLDYYLLYDNGKHLLLLFPLTSSHVMASFSLTSMTTSGKMLGLMMRYWTHQHGYQTKLSGMVSACNSKLIGAWRRKLD